MSDQGQKPVQPIGDPPARKQAVRADKNNKVDIPMQDPFTEQSTHPAGDGQGANAAAKEGSEGKASEDEPADEETMPVEQGFSAVP